MQDGQTGEAVRLEDHRFPCPTCGSDLRYLPGTETLKCDHCGHEEPIAPNRAEIRELDLRTAAENAVPPDQMQERRVVQCPSCGAEVEFDAALHAGECPFCASPLVTDTGVARQIKPQAQLPFGLGQDAARKAMNRWLGRLWFAPNNLQRLARAGRAMQGVYVPYWTYDAETRTDYTGQRGRVYYETRMVQVVVNGRSQMRPQQIARVAWTPVRGQVARAFDDVLVLGANTLPKRFTDALAPWDLSALAPYEPRYLAGFRAEGYSIPVEDAYGEARAIMDQVIAGDVRRDIGGDQQRVGQMNTSVGALTFKHILLPVWVAAYKYSGRTFRFVVNARTGSVEGERPYSSVKIAFAIICALLVAVAIAMLQVSQGGGYGY